MDHDQQTGHGFEAVPDEDGMTVSAADAGDDSDAPIDLAGAAGAAATGQTADANISGGHELVRGNVVTLTQGSAGTVEASTVAISQGGAGRVTADEVSISRGGVGFARADRLTVQPDGSAFAVVTDNATLERGANVFMLISRTTSGEARPVIDWRSALGLGGGMALVIALLRRLR